MSKTKLASRVWSSRSIFVNLKRSLSRPIPSILHASWDSQPISSGETRDACVLSVVLSSSFSIPQIQRYRYTQIWLHTSDKVCCYCMVLVNLSLDCSTLILEGCQLPFKCNDWELRILPLLFFAFEVWNEVSATGIPVSDYRTACLRLDLFLLACICWSPSLRVESSLRISSSLRFGICVVLK